ncbi:MAG TPA: VOC family protein [Terriglobales bacterium]|nr:VOC family protein [Terriglobales bacterium]
METTTRLTAILPCTNLDASEAFYGKLGFRRASNYPSYRILADGNGGHLHLTQAPEGWLVSGRNPFGLYLYTKNIDALAASLDGLLLHKPEHKPWGMYEFALSDPDEALVRIGWPSDEV